MSDKLRRETINSIKDVYRKYPSGGALHIVIDDGNTEDEHIYWCIENSIREATQDKDLFKKCAINLMKIPSWRSRDNCISIAWREYIEELSEKEN